MCSLYYVPLYLLPHFGGLEAVITGVCDIVSCLAKRRWVCSLYLCTIVFVTTLWWARSCYYWSM